MVKVMVWSWFGKSFDCDLCWNRSVLARQKAVDGDDDKMGLCLIDKWLRGNRGRWAEGKQAPPSHQAVYQPPPK
jgi:hypothetical protein